MTNCIPFFSVILPTFNRASIIQNAIDSVLNQKFKNWELIVVDDGSADNTEDIVRQYDDVRIKYMWKTNEERSIARNYGIERALGEYICFLDSDDQYLENHFEVLSKEINDSENKVAIFHTKARLIRNGKDLKHEKYFNQSIDNSILNFLLKGNLIMNNICIQKEILKTNNFPIKYRMWEDTHLWMRIVYKYPFHQINEYTTIWNQRVEDHLVKRMRINEWKRYYNYLLCMRDFEKSYVLSNRPIYSKEKFTMYKLKKIQMLLAYISVNHGIGIASIFALNTFFTMKFSEFTRLILIFISFRIKLS